MTLAFGEFDAEIVSYTKGKKRKTGEWWWVEFENAISIF